MGATPSAPSAAQREELEREHDALVERAAAAIATADVLVFLTGAGWSADSGLAVYKDIADIPAYHARGVTYPDLCQPDWVQSEPELFYGFWGMCFNDYRATSPHEGYSIVARWRDAVRARGRDGGVDAELRALLRKDEGEESAGAFFAFTSNVDAHSFTAFERNEVRECHGNTERWQCAGECTGRWPAPSGFEFAVDPDSMLAPGGAPRQPRAEAAADDDEDDGGGGDEQQQSAKSKPAYKSEAFASNHPRCPHCGGRARPAILMFGDHGWLDDDAQEAAWWRWQKALLDLAERRPPGLRVCVLEVGAGGNVTTVRRQSEEIADSVRSRGAEATLLRVNPDLPFADLPDSAPHTVPLLARGLATVRAIDAALQPLLQDPERASALLAQPLGLVTVGQAGRGEEVEEVEEVEEEEEGVGDDDDDDASAVSPDAPRPPCPAPTVPAEDKAWGVFDDVAAPPAKAAAAPAAAPAPAVALSAACDEFISMR